MTSATTALDMEFRELAAFVAIVEEGSLSAASRRLHVSQPSLTQTVQGLEHELGVALLQRTNTGVTPTDAGLTLLTEARALLARREAALRVMAEAVRWGKRGARVNTISPGIIITPLANDELKGPRGPGYRRMLEVSAAGRAGTPDEVGTVGALLMGPEGAFITGSDFLMDGGVTAAYWFGDLAPK